jgi:hypothetical protein
MFKNTVMRRIFGSKCEELRDGWKNLYNEDPEVIQQQSF